MVFDKSGDLRSQDPIYLNEDRADQPKEIFKMFRDVIGRQNTNKKCRALDVGCATGEFIRYLRSQFPKWQYSGMDISDVMIERASMVDIGTKYFVGDINAPLFHNQIYDIITCSGVVGFFDDLTLPLTNLLSFAQAGSTVLVTIDTTREDIDVIMRYRRSTDLDCPWEGGWNQFSRKTIERILKQLPYILNISWNPFKMPFAIEKRPHDPMRTWTVDFENDPFQTINGANQIVDLTLLEVQVLALDT